MGLTGSSQEAQKNSGPLQFSSQARLVTVPVIVTRSGRPVTGLKAADFSLTQDGKAQTIATFAEIATAAPRTAALVE